MDWPNEDQFLKFQMRKDHKSWRILTFFLSLSRFFYCRLIISEFFLLFSFYVPPDIRFVRNIFVFILFWLIRPKIQFIFMVCEEKYLTFRHSYIRAYQCSCILASLYYLWRTRKVPQYYSRSLHFEAAKNNLGFSSMKKVDFTTNRYHVDPTFCRFLSFETRFSLRSLRLAIFLSSIAFWFGSRLCNTVDNRVERG